VAPGLTRGFGDKEKYKMIELTNHNNKIQLRNTLFWDVDTALMDAEKSKLLIIERVLSRGNMNEFKQLIIFYDQNELKESVIKIGSLDARTLNFISGYLNIPKQNFLCYKKQQLNITHLNS
jgi:hypothetical protein